MNNVIFVNGLSDTDENGNVIDEKSVIGVSEDGSELKADCGGFFRSILMKRGKLPAYKEDAKAVILRFKTVYEKSVILIQSFQMHPAVGK